MANRRNHTPNLIMLHKINNESEKSKGLFSSSQISDSIFFSILKILIQFKIIIF